METNYKGHANESGVYSITNTTNGRVYIGSAKRFKQRYSEHCKTLEKGTHHNKYLQHDWNKCGSSVFVFEVLEVVEGEQSVRLLVEQTYLDERHDNQDLCYNFKKQAEAESRSCFSTTPEETRRRKSQGIRLYYSNPENRLKQSQRMKGIKKKPFTKEHCENLGKAHLGRVCSEQTKQKMSESAKQNCQDPEHIKIKSESGKKRWEEHPEHKVRASETMKEHYDKNPEAKKAISKTTKERWNDPEYKANLIKVLTGQKRSDETRAKISEIKKGNTYNKKTYTFMSPDGNEFMISNLKEFCDSNGLSAKSMYRLCWSTDRTHHKGWKFVNKNK